VLAAQSLIALMIYVKSCGIFLTLRAITRKFSKGNSEDANFIAILILLTQ
jgi:hypothetical protein